MGVVSGTVEEIIKMAHSKFVSEIKAGNYEELLRQMAFCSEYSVNNQMLLAIQNPDMQKVRSFDEWTKFERRVCKGQKSMKILVPKTEYIQGKKTNSLGVGCVFDISQTYGQEHIETLKQIYELSPEKVINALKQQLVGYKINSMPRTGGCDAVIDTTKREISINSELPKDKYTKLLIQQVIIAKSLHEKREDPILKDFSGSEVKLEIDSATLAIMSNIGLNDHLNKKLVQEIAHMDEKEMHKLKAVFSRISEMTHSVIEGTIESCMFSTLQVKKPEVTKNEHGKELVA